MIIMIIHKMKNLSQQGYQQYQKLHQKNKHIKVNIKETTHTWG